ncbi:hypothetical protein T4C_9840 [Trichinella pseudospiralis]|uniref:Uncharacterized protein n=1 Tax=Trichinella pseudospiralis TaxID=6337 RepID=A0A0V1JUT2_TRIPS|nr:hypothetical protein T4C_9840 [Trichinella pseudospiralis]
MSVYGSIHREPCLLLRQLVPLDNGLHYNKQFWLQFPSACLFEFASMCRKEGMTKITLDYVNSRSALRLVPATLSRPLSAHSKCGITEFKGYANAIENI